MKYRNFRNAFLFTSLCLLGITVSTRQSFAQSDLNRAAPKTAGTPIEQAIEINVTEINLSKDAESRAQNAHVKAFAQMMIKDHTDALAKLRAVAGAPAGDVKPNADHQKVADRLSKLSGSQFDSEYIGEMVTGHQTALVFFEQQGKQSKGTVTNATPTANDISFAKVAADLVPIVRMHLKEAKQIQTELGRIATPSPTSKGTNK